MFYDEKKALHLSKNEKQLVLQLLDLIKEGIVKIEYQCIGNLTNNFCGRKLDENNQKTSEKYLIMGEHARLIYDILLIKIAEGQTEFDMANIIISCGYSLRDNKFVDEFEDLDELIDEINIAVTQM